MTNRKKKSKKINNSFSSRDIHVPKTPDERDRYLNFLENLADKGRTFIDSNAVDNKKITVDYENEQEIERVKKTQKRIEKRERKIKNFFNSEWVKLIAKSVFAPICVTLIVSFYINNPDKKIEKSESNLKDFVKNEIASSSRQVVIQELKEKNLNLILENKILKAENYNLNNIGTSSILQKN